MSTHAGQSDRTTTPRSAGTLPSVLASPWAWVVITVLALSIRVIYLLQIQSIPFFNTLVGDAASYDTWAQRIAGGDWLGTESFYQAPAYPYFLGIVYRVIGRDMFTVRLVQACLGALSCLFIGLAGRTFFSRPVGLLAASLLALYPPAIFFDGLIQKTSLGLLLMTALLWRLAVVRERPQHRRWLTIGALLGVFGLTRENALVLVVVVLGWLGLGFAKHRPRRRLAWMGAVLAGLLITLGAVAYRNHHLGGEWAVTTVQAGPNFYIGNNPHATGRYTPLVRGHESPPFERQDARRLAEQATRIALTDKQVSQYWLRQSWDFIRSQPRAWLTLLGKKLLLVFNAYEITDTEGFSVYGAYAPLLGMLALVLHFGVIGPLAASGAVWSWPHRRRVGVLYAIAVALAVSIALFYVFARYRFPLIPVMILFASLALVESAQRFRRGERRALAAPAVALILAAIACNLPLNPERQLDAMAYANLGSVLAQRGDVAAAVEVFHLALEENPQSSETHYNLGLAYRVAGDHRRAIKSLLTAQRLNPTLIEVDYQLGAAYEALGDRPVALRHYRQALQLNPEDADARTAVNRLTTE